MDVVVPSLLGDNLAARLRSTSLALVGVVGAAALVTVGLTLQHGVPLVSSGPIHDPAKAEIAPARIVAAPPSAPRGRDRRAAIAATRDSEARVPVASPRSAPASPGPPPVEEAGGVPAFTAEPSPEGEGGGAAKHRPPSRATPKPSPAPPPQPAPAPASADQPVATPSSEPPPPVAEPPAAEPSPVPGKGNAYGKGGGNGPDGSGPPGLAGK